MSTKYRSYVESLTTAQRDALGTLSARVLTNVRPLYEVSGDISSFIFAGGETSHPDWDDATTVFEAAVEQLLLQPDVPPIAGELPLLFVGWHSKNRVTGKRASLGFLLTDRRLHAQCDFGVLFGVTPPRTYSYPIGSSDPDGDSAALVDAANARFDWTPAAELVSLAQQAAIKRLLVDEIADITGAVTRLGIEMAPLPATATDPRGRVAELGLGSSVKFPDDRKHSKHLAKVQKVFQLGDDSVILSVTDATLAGVYGLVVTDGAVVSRDLFEDPVRTARSEIDSSAIALVDGSNTVLINGQAHVFASSLSASERLDVVELLRSVLGQK